MESNRKISQNKTPQPKSARRISGYLLYSSQTREELLIQGEKITIAELGKQWSALPEKTKQKFNEKAEKIKTENLNKEQEQVSQSSQESLNSSISGSFSSNQIINRDNKSTNVSAHFSTNKSNKPSGYIKSSIKKFQDEKIEKYLSENQQKKSLRSSSSAKKIVEDDDSRLPSGASELENDEQTDKTRKTEATEKDKNPKSSSNSNKASVDNKNKIKKNSEENNNKNENNKMIIEEELHKKTISEDEEEVKEEENNKKNIINIENCNSEFKSDIITRSKVMQDGMMYRKDRSGKAPKTIRLCAEICAS